MNAIVSLYDKACNTFKSESIKARPTTEIHGKTFTVSTHHLASISRGGIIKYTNTHTKVVHPCPQHTHRLGFVIKTHTKCRITKKKQRHAYWESFQETKDALGAILFIIPPRQGLQECYIVTTSRDYNTYAFPYTDV